MLNGYATYLDQLQSGEYLDTTRPGEDTTLRHIYAPMFPSWDEFFRTTKLPNICGVGLFLITADDKLIVTRQSDQVTIYPGRFSYAASGTMDWQSRPNPFEDIARECCEELGEEIELTDVRLFSMGFDALKFYFQFSFVAHTVKPANEIHRNAPHARDSWEIAEIRPLDLSLESIGECLKTENWEPAAGASLITLCSKRFGAAAVKEFLGGS